MRMDAIPTDSYLTPSPGPLHLSSIKWQKFPLKVIVVFSEHPTMAKDLRSVPAVIPLQLLFYLSSASNPTLFLQFHPLLAWN